MIDVRLREVDDATRRTLTGVVVAWVLLWIVVGGWLGWTMWQLAELGDTVTNSGEAIESAGEALESLAAVPVVGDEPAALGAEVSTTGAEVADRGQDVKGQLRQMAVLFGLAIAVMPTAPVVALFVLLRRAGRDETAAESAP